VGSGKLVKAALGKNIGLGLPAHPIPSNRFSDPSKRLDSNTAKVVNVMASIVVALVFQNRGPVTAT
jgi:hypothetical protein